MAADHVHVLNCSTAENYTLSTCDGDGALEIFRNKYLAIHGYLATLICIAGVLGNVANIVVFTRPKMATSPVNHLLMMVAVADLTLVTVYLVQAIAFYIIYHEPEKEPLYLYTEGPANLLYFCTSFVVGCHAIAIWHTIAVAAFRWMTLAMPNGKFYCTLKNARICTLVLVIANCLVSITNWYTQHVGVTEVSNCHFCNQTFYTVMGREGIQFNNWLFAVFGKILPCTLLMILTILILIIMHRAEVKRQQLLSKGKSEESRRHQEHNRTTGMLLTVVVIFLLIELPHGIYIIIMGYEPDLMVYYSNLGELIDIVTLIAFSINFIMYSVMSRQFRTTFFSLFCKKTVQQQAINFRRLSAVVTNAKNHLPHRRSSQPLSNSTTNNSLHYRCEEKYNKNYLHPSASPLLSGSCEDRTLTTSICSDNHSGNGVAL